MTGVAEDLGAQSGAVTFMFLPRWVAQHIFELSVPIVVSAFALHARNLLLLRATVPTDPSHRYKP